MNLMLSSTSRSSPRFFNFICSFRRFNNHTYIPSSFHSQPKQDFIGLEELERTLNSNGADFNPDFISINTFIYNSNSKISSLGRDRKVNEARNVFDAMPQRDNVSYASMITVYLKNGDLVNAEKLFRIVPTSNVVINSAMIDAYAKASRIDEARRIFDEMPERNVISWTSLMSGYLRIGQIDEARKLFDRMPERNIVSWTTMVLGYARNGLISESRELFDQMPFKNIVAWTSMIKSYVENEQIDEARKLFHEMPFRNLYSWNIMLSGYLDNKRVNEAIELFGLMSEKNEVTWTAMVSGLARNGMTHIARAYFDEMPKKDVAAWNAMITAYADDGLMNEAGELFDSMPKKNTVTWNTIIDGYSRNGPEYEALKHLALMLRSGYRPNSSTITSVVTACDNVLEVIQIHALIIFFGFESETLISNAIITMYSRIGDIDSARGVFEGLETKDVVSWTSMILAYSIHGHGEKVLQVFARMLRSGTNPDHITFVGILSACSHTGLLQKGRRLFDSMSRAYGLEPKPEHYSCLIDLLGRAGHVDEAVKVMNQIPPSERDGTVLGTLLGACKLHGNVDVAYEVWEELIKLEPTSSGGYVLLANLYAARGKWDDFARIRKKMKEMKVKKVAGFSQIEVRKKSHVFYVGDRSHPEVNEIYSMLKEKLLPQMKDVGYFYGYPPILV